MRKIAMLVAALVMMGAKQAHAEKLLVKVGDTIYATEVAIGTLANTAGQVSSTRLAPHQESVRRILIGLLHSALNYEAGARNAAYACRVYANILVEMDPRDPRFRDVAQAFDNARDAAYQHARTARKLTESASNTANAYGMGGLLVPAVQKVRVAEQEAKELSWLLAGPQPEPPHDPLGYYLPIL